MKEKIAIRCLLTSDPASLDLGTAQNITNSKTIELAIKNRKKTSFSCSINRNLNNGNDLILPRGCHVYIECPAEINKPIEFININKTNNNKKDKRFNIKPNLKSLPFTLSGIELISNSRMVEVYAIQRYSDNKSYFPKKDSINYKGYVHKNEEYWDTFRGVMCNDFSSSSRNESNMYAQSSRSSVSVNIDRTFLNGLEWYRTIIPLPSKKKTLVFQLHLKLLSIRSPKSVNTKIRQLKIVCFLPKCDETLQPPLIVNKPESFSNLYEFNNKNPNTHRLNYIKYTNTCKSTEIKKTTEKEKLDNVDLASDIHMIPTIIKHFKNELKTVFHSQIMLLCNEIEVSNMRLIHRVTYLEQSLENIYITLRHLIHKVEKLYYSYKKRRNSDEPEKL